MVARGCSVIRVSPGIGNDKLANSRTFSVWLCVVYEFLVVLKRELE